MTVSRATTRTPSNRDANNCKNASEPLVSVVIPAFNCDGCLSRAIKSVLEQTYTHFQCIVVDDGSTDDTAAVAASYGGNVKLVRQENSGVSSARNTGIEHASGELIAFLDADDCWHPSKLEKQVQLLQEHQDVVLVSTDLITYSPERLGSGSLASVTQPYGPDIFEIHSDFLPLFRNPYLGTPSVMVRTHRAREVGGFDTTLPIGEDVDFFFRVCKGRCYAKIRQPLAIIHQRSGSLTRTLPGYRYNLEVIDRLEHNHPLFAHSHAEEFTRQRLSVYGRWIDKCLYMGKGQQARTLLRESKKHGRLEHPSCLILKSYFAQPIAWLRKFARRFSWMTETTASREY
ncbi:hypothetical protein CWI75_14840 [Kineobactrum sediminis]|uniref:Glycosyltransferase 2-like domain-containing protein n=1 Tax=Kineobactrum sediminis TaxID=1905677 RepID=A0A2N5XZE7_9GAMM|nr:glycosyltransferase family 2 protein [Kineobactrum sediminis]PLW81511.1 hypothetical protein CWI75_14840 [Kineobactrum sediminis]